MKAKRKLETQKIINYILPNSRNIKILWLAICPGNYMTYFDIVFVNPLNIWYKKDEIVINFVFFML